MSNEDSKMLRSVQRHSVIGIVALFISLCMVAGYALVMDSRRSETISQLSIALSQQREQFSDCTSDRPVVPVSTCDEPVAEEPAEIVKKAEAEAVGDATPDPAVIMGPTGPAGPSAYQIAIANGFRGSEPSWLASLEGDRGLMGVPGLAGSSAYQLARQAGFTGSEMQWLASLQGNSGSNGKNGRNGLDGNDGKSAYQLAVDAGFSGSLSAWLDSLEGPQGAQGAQGPKGADGANGSNGQDGAQGPQGEKGERGSDGSQGPQGERGPQGDRGPQGEAGPICPSNSYLDEKVLLTLEGTVQVFVCVSGVK